MSVRGGDGQGRGRKINPMAIMTHDKNTRGPCRPFLLPVHSLLDMSGGRPPIFDADDRQKCLSLFDSGLSRSQVRDKMNEDRCECLIQGGVDVCFNTANQLFEALQQEWLAIPLSLLDTLYYSMDCRMDVVRAKRGYPTHY